MDTAHRTDQWQHYKATAKEVYYKILSLSCNACTIIRSHVIHLPRLPSFHRGSPSHPAASNVRCAKAACRPVHLIAHNRLGCAAQARPEQVPTLLLHRWWPPDTVKHRRRRHCITQRARTPAHAVIVPNPHHGVACPIGPADAVLPLVGEAAEFLEAGGGEPDSCRRRRRHLFSWSGKGSGAAGFARQRPMGVY